MMYEKKVFSSYRTEAPTEELKSEEEDDLLEVTPIDGTELAKPKPIEPVHLAVAPTLAILGVFPIPKTDKVIKTFIPTILELS